MLSYGKTVCESPEWSGSLAAGCSKKGALLPGPVDIVSVLSLLLQLNILLIISWCLDIGNMMLVIIDTTYN